MSIVTKHALGLGGAEEERQGETGAEVAGPVSTWGNKTGRTLDLGILEEPGFRDPVCVPWESPCLQPAQLQRKARQGSLKVTSAPRGDRVAARTCEPCCIVGLRRSNRAFMRCLSEPHGCLRQINAASATQGILGLRTWNSPWPALNSVFPCKLRSFLACLRPCEVGASIADLGLHQPGRFCPWLWWINGSPMGCRTS